MTNKAIIMAVLKRKYAKAQWEYGNNNVFGIFLYGSQNYNIDTSVSDIDAKIIIIPTMKDIVEGKMISYEVVESNGEHVVYKDIRLMYKEILKQSINAVEILFTEYCIINPRYKRDWKKIKAMRNQLAYIHPGSMVKATYGLMHNTYKKIVNLVNEDVYFKDIVKQYTDILRLNDFIHTYSALVINFNECIKPERANEYRKMRMNPTDRDMGVIFSEMDNIMASAKEFVDNFVAVFPAVNTDKFENIVSHIIKKTLRA